MYIHTYVYTYVSYVCIRVSYVCIYIHTPLKLHLYAPCVGQCMHVCVYVCMYVSYVCMYIRMCTNTSDVAFICSMCRSNVHRQLCDPPLSTVCVCVCV